MQVIKESTSPAGMASYFKLSSARRGLSLQPFSSLEGAPFTGSAVTHHTKSQSLQSHIAHATPWGLAVNVLHWAPEQTPHHKAQ